jgi:hypothetical protein
MSHVILTWTFTQAKFVDGIPCEITRKIHLADISGRRQICSTRASVEDRKKADSINRSLMTFSNVITWLADATDSQVGAARRRRHSVYIPYCDSALTWLLKDCLGLNSHTVIVATVSPSMYGITDTLNTLKLATKARSIVNKPTINEDVSVTRIKELRHENNVLRVSLGDCAKPFRSFLPLQQFIEAQEKLKHNDELIRNLTSKWINKWASLVGSLGRDFEVVQKWKDFERSLGISAADSAFGSDLEDAEICAISKSAEAANVEQPQLRYRSVVTLGLKDAAAAGGSQPSGDVNGDITTQRHLQDNNVFNNNNNIQQQQPVATIAAADSSGVEKQKPSVNNHLEQDKAQARSRRSKLRQQLEQRRRGSTCSGQPTGEKTDVTPARRYSFGYCLMTSPHLPAGDVTSQTTRQETSTVELLPTINKPAATTAAAAAVKSEDNNEKITINADSLSPVTQLFRHLSDQLSQMCSLVSETTQRKYDYYTSFTAQLSQVLLMVWHIS